MDVDFESITMDAEGQAKWSDPIKIAEVFKTKKLIKEVSRKRLLISLADCEVTWDIVILLRFITFKKLEINLFYPNFDEKKKLELVLGENKLSFVPSEELKNLLRKL